MPLDDDLHPPWSPWRPFPDPRTGGLLQAPFGPGIYELRLAPPDGALVLVGIGANLAARMSCSQRHWAAAPGTRPTSAPMSWST